jgi:hypothetical protein
MMPGDGLRDVELPSFIPSKPDLSPNGAQDNLGARPLIIDRVKKTLGQKRDK